MKIEKAWRDEIIKHDKLIEVGSVAVASRIAADGSTQIGLIFKDEDGDAFAVLEDAAQFARVILSIVNGLKT